MAARSAGDLASVMMTVVLTLCALTTTGFVVLREVRGPPRPTSGIHFEAQPDWMKYADGGHRIGSPDAKAIVIEFSDFQCPACGQLEETLRETRKRFGDEFAVIYRHLPLDRIHKFAATAAIASECAAKQGRFEAMHAALFDHRDSLGIVSWRHLAVISKEVVHRS